MPGQRQASQLHSQPRRLLERLKVLSPQNFYHANGKYPALYILDSTVHLVTIHEPKVASARRLYGAMIIRIA